MADRYFSETPIDGERVVLDGPEAHHLIHVMRCKPGVRVVLFDGRGSEFSGAVERVGRSEVELSVRARHDVDRESPFELTLAVALPKGDRQKWLVEKAVEVGVSRLVPLKTARGVAQPVEQALERMRRTVVEASKQCGRNRLMEIAEPQLWADLVEQTRDVPVRVFAHPGGAAALPPMSPPQPALPPAFLGAVGPEGGFTAEELALAEAAHWQTIDLGPRILRVETAAIVLAALAPSLLCLPANDPPTRTDPSY